MDIAKYAGLFFLRSEYVYLPGLGNLEIKKTTSGYSSETGSAVPAKGEIIFKPTIGVIDDAFANFVANNERVSIASAANAIADFGKRVKAEVQEGGKVEIPGIGGFFNNGGIIGFEVNPSYEYKPKSIPIFKNVSRTEEYQTEKDIKEIIETTHFSQPKSEDEIELEKPTVNYAKLITLILVGVLILGGLGYLIYSLVNESKTETATEKPTKSKDIDESTLAKPATDDSTNTSDSNAINTPTSNSGEVAIIVNEYNDTFKANARVKKLSANGYNASRVEKDDLHLIIIKLPNSEKGGQFLADSIKPILNPKYNVRLLN